MKTATFIRDCDNFSGAASLYKCDPPIDGHEYIVASATIVPYSGPETYLFPSNEFGQVTDWAELSGSQSGTLSHTDVFTDIGYSIIGE